MIKKTVKHGPLSAVVQRALIGYAIAVNSLVLHRYRRVAAPPGQLAA